jgi:hypothetical protein
MSLIRLNRHPTPRDLRVFSTLWFFFLGIFGAIAWRKGAASAALAWWSLGTAGGVTGFVFPPAMRWVYLAATYITFPIGFVVSYLILGAVYYLVLAPTGLIMRAFGHDSLSRRFAPDQKTYWKPRAAPKPAQSYFRQH